MDSIANWIIKFSHIFTCTNFELKPNWFITLRIIRLPSYYCLCFSLISRKHDTHCNPWKLSLFHCISQEPLNKYAPNFAMHFLTSNPTSCVHLRLISTIEGFTGKSSWILRHFLRISDFVHLAGSVLSLS